MTHLFSQEVYQTKPGSRYRLSQFRMEVDFFGISIVSSGALDRCSAMRDIKIFGYSCHHREVERSTMRHKANVPGNHQNGYDVLLRFVFKVGFRMRQS